MNNLEQQFENELREKMVRSKKECHYNPSRFLQMLAEHGGVATAKMLLKNNIATDKISDGFTTLYMCGRLDLSMEDSVCKPEYRSLFTQEEIDYCKKILGRE